MSQLMLDGYGCCREKLADIDFVLSILETLPAKIGANKVAPPQIFKYQGGKTEEWGVSGVVMVDKSHISVHTFPEKEHVFVDIFSNEEFNTASVEEELLHSFGAKQHKSKIFHLNNEAVAHAAGQLVEQPRVLH